MKHHDTPSMMLHVEPAFLCIADAPLELLTALPQHAYGVMALLADTGECTDGIGPKVCLPAMTRHNAVVEYICTHHALAWCKSVPQESFQLRSVADLFLACLIFLGLQTVKKSSAPTCNRGTDTGMHYLELQSANFWAGWDGAENSLH